MYIHVYVHIPAEYLYICAAAVYSSSRAEHSILISERRSQLYRMTPVQLKETFENELIPQLLERSRLNRNWLVVKEAVKFAFITGASNDSEAVMDQLLDVNNLYLYRDTAATGVFRFK